jgi:hypothetical protein
LLFGYSFFICSNTEGQAASTVDIFFRYVDRRSGSRTYIKEQEPMMSRIRTPLPVIVAREE